MNWADVTGVVLAAGKGTRMGELGCEFPKPLLPICNRPILVGQLELMRELGIRRSIIVVGHLGPQLVEYLALHPVDGLDIEFVLQESTMGIAHAVGRTEPKVQGPVLVALGDIFFRPLGIDSMLARLDPGDDSAVLAVKREPVEAAIRRNFTVHLDSAGLVQRVVEKPRVVHNDLKGCGIYLFGSGIFDAIRRTPRTAARDEYEITESIQILIDSGGRVRAAEVIEDDVNVTSPHDLLEVNLQELRRQGQGSMIGRGAQVHPGAVLRNAVVGPEARISAAVEVIDSVVLGGATLDRPVERAIVTPSRILGC